ncbi:MAG: aspartate carbamoyltransferase catalytic subunit [Candidatus Latescibacteria bacterium]|nr:aspartate carbamoyltransferase catalytic subunit [Candidatus Latescibacterota bacterium]NIM22306.1 aspartate carbamoyltransferase catalytic subunit [Candidatus Latescibacterota bacterium]NIM66135.1 aspartate carbamoyltransferase catalytic subunit [Candidatus Latescibacterota bacterium]NIO02543.1 aspartate carbamoyltransferase catalytic subunit [Candidatus Latescibacterota bacterium]NIO29457.1 aspartate carbamoyltransferase catalytic subunit [Candidatus Latescibacterota bacterium]
MTLGRNDLLGLEGMSAEEINLILDTADSFKEISERPVKKVPALRGKTVVNLFFEPSTRTRTSFELAEKRLSADTVNISASTSSVKKGETLRDTAENIQAMKIDLIVMRHSAAGAPHFLAGLLDAAVVNAGDGCHEHPTQGLLDIFTLREKLGDLRGKRIVIVGDVAHSRVARSDVFGLTTLGAEVVLCAPPTMIPRDIERFGVQVETNLKRAIEGADAINVLRIQLERQKVNLFPSSLEYNEVYGITAESLAWATPECLIMHPGPMNRGVEISQEVADSDRAVILDQVTNGVAVRMAVLYLICGVGQKEGLIEEEVQSAPEENREAV